MKKILLLILVLSLVFVGCGKSDDKKDDDDKQSKTEQKDDDTGAKAEDSKSDDSEMTDEAEITEEPEEVTEQEEEKEEEKEEETPVFVGNVLDEIAKKVSYNAALTGMELIDSVKHDDIGDLMKGQTVTMEMKGMMSQMGQEMPISAFMVMQETRQYIEYDIMGMQQVMLSIDGEDVDTTYMYMVGETTGTYSTEEHEEDDEDISSIGSIYDIYDPEFGELVDAHVEMYEDKEVIYIEYSDGPDYLVKMWYYPMWNVAIKEETYSEGELTESMEIIRFEITKDGDESYFEIPADIEFTEGMGMGF